MPIAASAFTVAILDDESLLATCAYIDLNPLAAGIVKGPEEAGQHTSFRARLDHCHEHGTLPQLRDDLSTATRAGMSREVVSPTVVPPNAATKAPASNEPQHWLLPIEDDREGGAQRPGLLGGFTLSCDVRLLDWTSRLVRTGKARVSAETASLFERLRDLLGV